VHQDVEQTPVEVVHWSVPEEVRRNVHDDEHGISSCCDGHFWIL